MKEIKIEKCPYCGGTELLDTLLGSNVYASSGGLRTSVVRASVCRDCGSIVRAYVVNAEKLYSKNQRREND